MTTLETKNETTEDREMGDIEVGDKKGADEGEIITFLLLIHDLRKKITCKVHHDDSLWTVKRKVLNNTSAKKFADGLNYGFFCPTNSGRIGKYLSETRAIGEFSDKDFQDLQFRYKKKTYKNLPSNLKKLRDINDLSHRKNFIQAIISNKINDAKKMLKKGHDPNYQDFKTGETPMTCAILHKAPVETLVLLFEEGAHLDLRNSSSMTPMHVAATGGNMEILETLIELRASPNVRNSENLTPLHCLCSGPNFGNLVPCCQLLLENYSVLDVADEAGNTELHHACKQGGISLARRLVLYGANINRQNSVGNTPLHMAIFNNQELISRKLLVYGADKFITNRASYDCYAAAVTVGNKELADYTERFQSAQVVPIDEKPKYHPNRKADNTRRPSMQAFLNEQQKKFLLKTSLMQRLSNLGDSGIEDESGGSGGSGSSDDKLLSLNTPDEQDVNKIGDYISRIFGSIQEDEAYDNKVKTTSGKRSGTLFVPTLNQRVCSSSNINIDSYSSDEFTDSDDEVSQLQMRSKRPVPSARPTSLYLNPQRHTGGTVPSASLVAIALQKQMQQHSSTLSLHTQYSPMPLKKLQHSNNQEELKIASIRSYPKRLINSETGRLDATSGLQPQISLSVSGAPKSDERINALGYSTTANPLTIKQRPSLKDVFPFDSHSRDQNFGTLPKKPLPLIPVINYWNQTQSAPILDEPNTNIPLFPEIKVRESIYEEIPIVKITNYPHNDNIKDRPNSNICSFGDQVDIPLVAPNIPSGQSDQFGNADSEVSVTDGPYPVKNWIDIESIYANIGPDGLPLSYYYKYKQVINNTIQPVNKPMQTLKMTRGDVDVMDEGGKNFQSFSEVAQAVTRKLTNPTIEDSNNPWSQWPESGEYSQQQQQQQQLQQNQQQRQEYVDWQQDLQPIDQQGDSYQQELERARLQRQKFDKPKLPEKNPHWKLRKVTSNSLQQQQHSQQLIQAGEQQQFRGKQRPMTSFFESSQLSLRSLDTPDDFEFQSLPVSKRVKLIEGSMSELSNSTSKILYTDDETDLPAASADRTNIGTGRSEVKRRTVAAKLLHLPQGTLPRASSCQTVFHLPPPPPQRISSVKTTASVLPEPPLPTFPQDNSLLYFSTQAIPPPPSFIPQAESPVLRSRREYEAGVRAGNSTLVLPKADYRMGGSLNTLDRSSTFEPFNTTLQDNIKKRMNQLRLSSGDSADEVTQWSDGNGNITFVPGKSTSMEFEKIRTKMESLLPHDGQFQHVDGYFESSEHHQPRNLGGAQIVTDERTGQKYLQIDSPEPQDWSV